MTIVFEKAGVHDTDAWCEERIERADQNCEQGDDGTARAILELVTRVDPMNWKAHMLLGAISERAGNCAAAHTHYVLAFHFGWEDPAAVDAMDRMWARKNNSVHI